MKPEAPEPVDNRAYYDAFAASYEERRGFGYHQMVDDLEVGLVKRYAAGKEVLDVGCGTGLLLTRIKPFASRAVGIDISPKMLEKAMGRDLEVSLASVLELPFPDHSFDVVCSFKVLAHVEEIHRALGEMARVCRPGGIVLAEFYNPRSLRYLVKFFKSPTRISSHHHDDEIYTRYDSQKEIRSYFPPGLSIIGFRGIRIVTPIAGLLIVPALGDLVKLLETRLADLPIARNFGGFLVAIAQKSPIC